jgi:tetratricopeptide (TPR) repeat protein
LAYATLGRFEDARRTNVARTKLCRAACDWEREAMERGWARGGWEGALRAWLEAATKMPGIPATFLADLCALTGETDAAFAWLERAYRQRDYLLHAVTIEPSMDALRIDPRFQDLVRRIGFPEIGEEPGMLAEIGRALAFAQRPDEAVAKLERAMQRSPADSRMSRWLDSMSMAHFAAGRYEQAADWSGRVLTHDVSTYAAAFAHLLRASSYADLDRADAARAALAEALKRWPRLEIDRDLRPLFLAGSPALRDRYVEGLRKAGLEPGS